MHPHPPLVRSMWALAFRRGPVLREFTAAWWGQRGNRLRGGGWGKGRVGQGLSRPRAELLPVASVCL